MLTRVKFPIPGSNYFMWVAVVFWGLYGGYYFLINSLTVPNFSVIEVLISVPIFALIAWGAYAILDRWVSGKRPWLAGIVMVVFFALIAFLVIGAIDLANYLMPDVNQLERVSFTDAEFLSTMAVVNSKYAMYGVGAYLLKRLLENIEEKHRYEYRMLAGQVSPHFIANLIAQWIVQSEDGQRLNRQSMQDTHELMQYYMNAGLPHRNLVTIDREIDQIENYLALMQREGQEVHVDWSVTGDVSGYTIPPLSLFQLVENATKHGHYDNPAEPIEIVLKLVEKRLQFTCTNIERAHSLRPSHGLGLSNLRRRMELAYGDRFRLFGKSLGGRYVAKIEVVYP